MAVTLDLQRVLHWLAWWWPNGTTPGGGHVFWAHEEDWRAAPRALEERQQAGAH